MRDAGTHSHLDVIAAMLAVIAELRARHDARAVGDQAQALAPALAQAERLLCSNLEQTLPVRAVASRVGLEWETFRRQFRARTQQSPAAYRNQARLRHAQHLLTTKGWSVAAVAKAVGYVDAATFTKAFLRRTGLTPAAVQRRSDSVR